MAEITIDENLFLAFVIISIISSIAIIILLAVQSFVLVKLMPLIRTTAQNSSMFTEVMNPIKKIIGIKEEYPHNLLKLNIKNCKHHQEKTHVHTTECV